MELSAYYAIIMFPHVIAGAGFISLLVFYSYINVLLLSVIHTYFSCLFPYYDGANTDVFLIFLICVHIYN